MLTTGMDNRTCPGMACSECNDLLVAPKSSAYVSNHEIRHVWSCESCGHEIEMAVNLRSTTMSAQNRQSLDKH
jgi:RNase P subunit RPR2